MAKTLCSMKKFIQRTGLFLLFVFFAMPVFSQSSPSFTLSLWGSEQPPVSNEITTPEIFENGFFSNVSVPELIVYPAKADKNTGMAMLIAPGGGYGALAIGYEGEDFARWFAENGITGVVLKYRMPNGHHSVPLDDAQQAMRQIRQHAQAWNVNPQRIGVMGFSAGGHLASTLLTHFDSTSRPNFGVLCYPVVTFDDRWTHRGSVRNLVGENPSDEMRLYYSNEKQVSDQTPPTLIFYSDDDKSVMPVNGAMFYEALKAHKIPAALYIFPSGGHGWGFRSEFKYHDIMKQLMLDWLTVLPAEQQ